MCSIICISAFWTVNFNRNDERLLFVSSLQIDELARNFKGINQTINDENTPLSANQSAATNKNMISTKTLLSIQHKNLNPSFEMKRMFGSKVVQMKQ